MVLLYYTATSALKVRRGTLGKEFLVYKKEVMELKPENKAVSEN